MQRFLTHLTLVAYLVGGWLLPAAHHHAPSFVSDGQGLHDACCVSTAADHGADPHVTVADGSTACEADTACDCPHDAVVHLPIIDTDTVIAPTHTHSHDCVGLCAGCVAQSLVGTHAWVQSEWAWLVHAEAVCLADPALVLSERYGFALSRGPPAAV